MAYEYPVTADGSRPQIPRERELLCLVQECLDTAFQALRRCEEREQFPALVNLILACKDAEEAVR